MTDDDFINVPGLMSQPAPVDQQLMVETSIFNDQVVLHFNQPREYVALTGIEPLIIAVRLMALGADADSSFAQKAVDLCGGLVDYIYAGHSHIKMAGSALKAELVERHRKTLMNRIPIVLNSQREKKTVSNQALARKLIDIMLHEVLP